MTSITDPGICSSFSNAIEQIQNQHIKALGKITDSAAELCQTHKQFVKAAQDACLKKRKDDDMFDTIESFKKDLEYKSKSLKDKGRSLSELMSEIEQKEMKKEEIILKMEKLREEQAKRREAIETQNKANKQKLKNLQKARLMFQDNLGLEIRVIKGESDVSRDVKMQFVFRNINRSDLNSTYIVTLGLNAEGAYQIVSSDPALQCLPNLEKQLLETNNLTAFLANLRKEFIAVARQ